MALLNGTSQYLPVTPGDVITFGDGHPAPLAMEKLAGR